MPPPPTNSLNIPGFPGPILGSPNGTPVTLPQNQLPGGGMAPGVYFPAGTGVPNTYAPGTGSAPIGGPSPWHSAPSPGFGTGAATGNPAFGTGNVDVPTVATIPGRGTASVAPQTFNPAVFERTNVPPLLSGGFDPYDTSTIPTWSQNPSVAGSANPLVSTNNSLAPPGAADGWWPGQFQGSTANSRPKIGSGQLLKKWFGRFQPANVTGYVTTTPIENPMIPVTQMVQARNPPVGTGSLPMGTGSFPVGTGSFPVQAGVGTSRSNNVSFARALEAQQAAQTQARQMFAWQQAQMAQQAIAQGGVMQASHSVGQYQVLAESSTSPSAEWQSRMAGVAMPTASGVRQLPPNATSWSAPGTR